MRHVLYSALLLAGCIAEPTLPDEAAGTRESDIIGGTLDSGDPGVVLLYSSPGYICTAEVISPTVLLTAAHCVSPQEVGQGATFRAYFGADANAGGGQWINVKEVHNDPAFDSNNLEGGHDVGIAILASPTTVKPLPYNRTAITSGMVGQSVRLVGYGLNNASTQSGAGTKRQTTTKLYDYNSLLLHIGTTGNETCNGDSGGPAFMNINGVETIVGVTSYGTIGCTGGGYDTRVDRYLAFIDQYVGNGGGNTCTPNCTGKVCGDNGCGGSCGSCANGATCSAGQCVAQPPPSGGCATSDESEPNDQPAQANKLCAGNLIRGTIGNANDQDWFTWTVTANKSYYVTLSNITRDYGMVLYKLSNGSLTQVALAPSNHDGAAQQIARYTSSGGTYYLLVGSYDGSFDPAGRYKVTVQIQ